MTTGIFRNNSSKKILVLAVFVLYHVYGIFLNSEISFAQTKKETEIKTEKKTEKKTEIKTESNFNELNKRINKEGYVTDYFSTYCGGVLDTFKCPTELAVRDAALVNMLTTRYATSPCFGFLDFDDIPWRNAGCTTARMGFFVHKLSFPIGNIVSATLIISCKAAAKSKTNSDYIAFYQGTNYICSSFLRDLPGAAGTWNNNQQATFYFNLSNLPIAPGFDYNSVLAFMLDGDLDIVIGSETGVDYMCLSLEKNWFDAYFHIEAMPAVAFVDSVSVELRNPNPPYALINDVDIFSWGLVGGKFNVRVPLGNAIPGNSYYVVLKHRNSIATWSAAPVTIGIDSTLYDFTTSVNQAYGNNMTIVDGLASFYSGDINQDGTIDAEDLSQVENDAANSLSGYVVSDLNGDNFVDAGDLSVVDNNAYIGVYSVIP